MYAFNHGSKGGYNQNQGNQFRQNTSQSQGFNPNFHQGQNQRSSQQHQNFNQGYNQGQGFNPGQSYGNNQNQGYNQNSNQGPPPGFQSRQNPPPYQNKPPLPSVSNVEAMLQKLLDANAMTNDRLLALEKVKGQFPGQPHTNPAGLPKQVNQAEPKASQQGHIPTSDVKAISTRSGKTHGVTPLVLSKKKSPKPSTSHVVQDGEKVGELLANKTSGDFEDTLPPFKPSAPFPSRLRKNRARDLFEDIKPLFDKLSITVPFQQAIESMPRYAKYLKELCTKKRLTKTPKSSFGVEFVDSLHQVEGIVKHADPGRPTVLCTIKDHTARALIDTGAGVSVLPYYLYKLMGLQEYKKIKLNLQFTDRLVKPVRGLVEDILIKVGEFYYHVDFVLLDIEVSKDNKVPIILGRPFLSIANADLEFRTGDLTVRMG